MARPKKVVSTVEPVKPAPVVPKRRKRVAGWHEHKGPKGDFFTSDNFAAYPQPDGRFKAWKIDENGTLGIQLGIFANLEDIKDIEEVEIEYDE